MPEKKRRGRVGYRPYAMDPSATQAAVYVSSARMQMAAATGWRPEMRESFKPPPEYGLPDWMSKQTAPRVAAPPTAREAIPAYCGHQPLVQVEMEDEKTALEGEPKCRLRGPDITEYPCALLSPSELSLSAASGLASPSTEIVQRPHHINGYTGSLPGSWSQEEGKLQTVRTSEIAEELRKLSKGINNKTFAAFNVLAKVPVQSTNQERMPSYSIERQDKVGSRFKFIRNQSAETKYANTYVRSTKKACDSSTMVILAPIALL